MTKPKASDFKLPDDFLPYGSMSKQAGELGAVSVILWAGVDGTLDPGALIRKQASLLREAADALEASNNALEKAGMS